MIIKVIETPAILEKFGRRKFTKVVETRQKLLYSRVVGV